MFRGGYFGIVALEPHAFGLYSVQSPSVVYPARPPPASQRSAAGRPTALACISWRPLLMAEQTLNIPQLIVVVIVGFVVLRWFFSSPSPSSGNAARPRAAAAGRRVDPAQVEMLSQMFPQVGTREIAWDLQRNGGNPNATSERILSGRALDTVSLHSLEAYCWAIGGYFKGGPLTRCTCSRQSHFSLPYLVAAQIPNQPLQPRPQQHQQQVLEVHYQTSLRATTSPLNSTPLPKKTKTATTRARTKHLQESKHGHRTKPSVHSCCSEGGRR
jgi:CUE domain